MFEFLAFSPSPVALRQVTGRNRVPRSPSSAPDPPGLMLGHLLHLRGIDSVILESRSRDYVVERVRAGVLEQGTVDLMTSTGVGDRLRREGMRHAGVHLAFNGRRHRIDMAELTGGRAITIYGQNEVVKDLIEARLRSGRPLHFEVGDCDSGAAHR